MPRLACRTCGRQVYTTAPIEALFTEERRCPRCGVLMTADVRERERRQVTRRRNPARDPGPPGDDERRSSERRVAQRRRPVSGTHGH
jgi:DNA-directed RNA polymerase subunit RPC12/RpoP